MKEMKEKRIPQNIAYVVVFMLPLLRVAITISQIFG